MLSSLHGDASSTFAFLLLLSPVFSPKHLFCSVASESAQDSFSSTPLQIDIAPIRLRVCLLACVCIHRLLSLHSDKYTPRALLCPCPLLRASIRGSLLLCRAFDIHRERATSLSLYVHTPLCPEAALSTQPTEVSVYVWVEAHVDM